MMTSEVPGQLSIFDALDADKQHVLHLENELDGVRGDCWCGYSFFQVTDGALLMYLISNHCEPISE